MNKLISFWVCIFLSSVLISQNSILSSGEWYKIGVTQTGIYSIDLAFLNSLGLNVAEINPQNIRVYGNIAGVLEEGSTTIDDLQELSIQIMGENDQSFDSDDKILFFGQAPDLWKYAENTFNFHKNIYSDTTYYYLNFDLGPGKRIEKLESVNGNIEPNYTSYSYDDYIIHENDLVNLVNTGRKWFGESFAFDQFQAFSYVDNDIDLQDSIKLVAGVAARSSVGSTFGISNNENTIASIYIPSISSTSNDYYRSVVYSTSFLPTSTDLGLLFNYNHGGNPSALAWLDYFTLVYRSKLFFNGDQFTFRDVRSVGDSVLSQFIIDTNMDNIHVWDVTDPVNTTSLDLSIKENGVSFLTRTDSIKEFQIFNHLDYYSPNFIEFVDNQNLHGAEQPDYIIITHPDFINSANKLASHYITNNNQNVLVATTKQVYNEFSTGSQDVSAIRNFVKMFYDKSSNGNDSPKNLLLLGDASFDYKNILGNSSNYVPTYESLVSSSIQSSFCTDDYFGVLDDHEGFWNGGLNNNINTDLIDIGIGRIPVVNAEDAELFVDKIINYNNSSIGSWKNKICFVADDADAGWEVNLITHADALAQKIDTTYDQFNIDKIYLDSYPQSLSAGSQRYPDAQEDLINTIKNGAFIINYVGHGGEIGWASERILELSDIMNLENIDNLPLFITATCEFTRYDDPDRVSAGEYLIMNPNGGAVGLYSTSRTVAESPTYSLVNALYNYLPNKNLNLTFGESLMRCKNDSVLGYNSVKRKFSFFGDPNSKLAHPVYNVVTKSVELLDSIGQPILLSEFSHDTIQSLSHVRVSGEIVDNKSVLVPFFGEINIIVFDKENKFNTLNNDGFLQEPFQYNLQKNIIYNGKVNVENGFFQFEFIVPKDIIYEYGYGKFSYYATDDYFGEATGAHEDVLIGGVSQNAGADIVGPVIDLFMNDTNFVSGGYTNNHPYLLAYLFDESGINTVGTGIGHNLTVILDENTVNQYILNDYYQADLNTYKSGKVVFPFSELDDGEHTLTFKAWDVYNNFNSENLSFFVTSSSELVINQLFNYPNPTSSFTRFVFEHNRPDDVLDLRIDIYSLDGKLVKSFSKSNQATGFRNETITWDIDSSVPRGIYIYRLYLSSKNDNSISEKTEKLIIVR